MHGASPGEDLGQELSDAFGFVGGLFWIVVAAAFVVGLVPEVPAEDAVVSCEGADDAFDVGLELRFVGAVFEFSGTGTLHPAGVVDAGDGRMLRAEMRLRVPAGVEEDKQGADVGAWRQW